MRNDPRALLPEHALGILPPPAAARMDRLVQDSPALREEMDELLGLLASLPESLPPIEPSLALRRRVLGSLVVPTERAPVIELWPAPEAANRRAGPPDGHLDGPTRCGQGPPRLRVIAAVLAITLLGALAVGVTHPRAGGTLALLAGRAPALAWLLFAQIAGLWAALAPKRALWAGASFTAAAAGAAAVLATHAGATSDAPGWICAIIQGVGCLAPLALVVSALRGSSFSWRRALSAGVALGTAGAIWGEIGCDRTLSHVVASHGGTWLALATACVLLWRALSRASPARVQGPG
jgi:hypothetical protein